MKTNDEIDINTPPNTDNLHPPNSVNTESTNNTDNIPNIDANNYALALQYIMMLSARNQHKLILEVLDSQGQLGQNFITQLYQHLENNEPPTSRKRRNQDPPMDHNSQTTSKIQAISTQPELNEDPTVSITAPQVSDRLPIFPPRQPPSNQTQPPSSQLSSNDPPNYFPGSTNKVKIPPITIINPKTYQAIMDLAKQGQFNILYSKSERNDAIKVYPATVDDYRTITKVLEQNDQEFISRNIDETKLLKVVLRNVPKFADVNEIAHELRDQGHEITKADRMFKKHPDGSRTPYSLVLLQLPHGAKAKEIYNVKHVCGFAIKVEPKRTTMSAMQCHNCQSFGHNQASCRVNPRCHRCAGAHHYTNCTKPTTTPALCCNCGGNHPANFSGCPRFPKTHNPLPQVYTPHIIQHPAHVQNGVSYAQTLTGNNNPLINAINQLQMALTAFLTSPPPPPING